MSKHVAISPAEAADRLAIRGLVEAYAHRPDRRDAEGQMTLFTSDPHFVVYMNIRDPKPSQELHSREAPGPIFAELNRYDATTHFVGQSTILELDDDRARPSCLERGRQAASDDRLAPLSRRIRQGRR